MEACYIACYKNILWSSAVLIIYSAILYVSIIVIPTLSVV